jgi:hypothetical protein
MNRPQITVEDFTYSVYDHDSSLTIRYGTIRLHLSISGNNMAGSEKVYRRYVQYIQEANEASESPHDVMYDLVDWITEGCDAQLPKVQRSSIPSKPTLHDFYDGRVYRFALHATANDLFMLKPDQNDTSEFYPHHLTLFEEYGSLWRCFEPSEVEILASTPEQALSENPRKVFTEAGGPYYFKRGLVQHELETYAKIEQADLQESRISRLCGIVRKSSGTITGLLLRHIGPQSVTLRRALKRDVSPQLRSQWIEQLTMTLRELHAADVVWGDAKAENVLIDSDNNAWIIDFGGGYTAGWVDENLANTVEGDQQGLSRIITHICRQ